ncbi:metalloprotease [Tenacibaculum sp. Bg11-29]|uniref:metalloprotease n=1 Tax=Tenacibaculum sp. Bg11-29 TaxID=2058306 RepID=UPI000C337E56|nr:metalloprotease [Tenacibaculum sp. Bg11-29]PKH51374.1 metalloprotease [Tenacibaculum sp. Bg11-29]
MKKIIKLMTLAILVSLQSCDKQEIEKDLDLNANSPEKGLLPSEVNNHNTAHNCATVSQFGPNSYWANTIVNTNETNFLKQQNNKASSLFGISNVPLYFAAGNGTFNALSYGPPNNYIIWGEEMLSGALNYGRSAVAYIVAHEVAHQIQFRQGYPSVTGASNTELEADGFAGYFLRRSYTTNWSDVIPAYNFAQSIAGSNGSSHGTAAQRRSSVRLGWLLANNGALSNADLDYNFFYYYNSHILPGKLKSSNLEKPKKINEELHKFMLTKIEELSDIHTGKISEEEYANLGNN